MGKMTMLAVSEGPTKAWIIPLLAPFLIGSLLFLMKRIGFFNFPIAFLLLILSTTSIFAIITWRATIARRKAELERTSTEERFRGFLEWAPDAILVINGEGIIQIVNKQAEKIFLYDRVELVGHSLEILLPERFRGGHIAHRLKYVADPTVRAMGVGLNLLGRRKDGTEFPVDISLSPLFSATGTLYSSAIRDVSDRRVLEKERQFLLEQEREFRARAERATRLRDELVAMVSHDLKNPLTSILLSTQMMERAPPGSEIIAKNLERMKRSAEQMQMMIKDLLDSHQIEAGQFELRANLVKCDPLTLVRRAEESQKDLANQKSLSLRLEVSIDLPMVSADMGRVLQVFQNLIGNAIKFTQKHGVIKITAEALGSDVVFGISDNGPGIEAGLVAHVFERFSQDSKTAKPGSGLGLSISKAIEESHGGRIWAESKIDQGTRFFFTLPQYRDGSALLQFALAEI